MRMWVFMLTAGFAMAGNVPAMSGPKGLPDSCKQCHTFAKSDVKGESLDHIWQRQGPDLYYAGLKFNQEWLVNWLQDPKPIRPGGVFYKKVVSASAEGADHIDKSKLLDHPKLSAADAVKAADALMTLKENPGGIVEGAYKTGKANIRFGKMSFNKLRGCAGCHENGPEKGGLSGSELFTAGARLQPDFIASYIINPQAIDPSVWMPKMEMSDRDIQNLTGYLLSLGKGD